MTFKHKEIIIFGIGGVGSWLAEFIVRNKVCEKLTLVDFDLVEKKNLRRQNYILVDDGEFKVEALR